MADESPISLSGGPPETQLALAPAAARERLQAGHCIEGPAIVEQYDSTTVVFPEQVARVDGYGNLLVERRDTAA